MKSQFMFSSMLAFGVALAPVWNKAVGWTRLLTRVGHALDSCREHLVQVYRSPDSITKQTGGQSH
jgi:hypothetical protein